jgi:hypothetical protein
LALGHKIGVRDDLVENRNVRHRLVIRFARAGQVRDRSVPTPEAAAVPSETETGTNNPMMPTTSTNAPTTRTNRRNVTPRSFARCRSPGS